MRAILLERIAADVFGAPITHALVADMFAATKAAMQTELLMIMLLMVPTKCESSMTPASHNAARRGRGAAARTRRPHLTASLLRVILCEVRWPMWRRDEARRIRRRIRLTKSSGELVQSTKLSTWRRCRRCAGAVGRRVRRARLQRFCRGEAIILQHRCKYFVAAM